MKFAEKLVRLPISCSFSSLHRWQKLKIELMKNLRKIFMLYVVIKNIFSFVLIDFKPSENSECNTRYDTLSL